MASARFKILLGAACSAAVFAFLFAERSRDPRSANPRPDSVTREGSEPVAPLPNAGSALTIRVLGAKEAFDKARVTVVIADKRNVVHQARLGLADPPLVWRQADGVKHVVVAATADGMPADALHELQRRCRWPAPITARLPSTTEVALEFVPTTPVVSSELYAVSDEGNIDGVRACLRLRHRATRVTFPIAFPVVGAPSSQTRNLPDGLYNVDVLSVPPPYRQDPRHRSHRFELRDGSRAVTVIRCVASGDLSGRVEFEDDTPRRTTLSIYELVGTEFRPIKTLNTEEDGSFRDISLPSGQYYVVTWPRGFASASARVRVVAGVATSLTIPVPRRGARVSGVLRDDAGNPVSRERMNLNGVLGPGVAPTGRTTATDASGRFGWDGVDPGEYEILLWDRGLRHLVRVNTDSVELPLVLPASRKSGRKVRGYARSGTMALRSAFVCLRSADSSWIRFASTQRNGAYSFDKLDPGVYELWVQPSPMVNGFAPTRPMRIDVRDGDASLDLDVPTTAK